MDIRVYSLKENESPYDLKECCDKCGCVLGKDEFISVIIVVIWRRYLMIP